MVPKIEFRYSWIYDEKYRGVYNEESVKRWGEYPSSNEILTYIEKIKNIWKRYDKMVLLELEKIIGLKWKEDKIICYVIGIGKPFSDPMTISLVNRNPNRFIDTLIHELIHQIQGQDKQKFLRAVKPIWERHNKESKICKNHILLNAIYKELFLRLFNKERLNLDIEKSKYLSEGYRRAWEIVEEEGHNKIIKEFKERL